MKDIRNRKDLELLVARFYSQIRKDAEIGFFFTEVVDLNFEKHLAIICDFWESLLFDKMTYQRNTMLPHLKLNKQHKLEASHFKTWLAHWQTSINANFQGETAELAKTKAEQIAKLMQFKLKTS